MCTRKTRQVCTLFKDWLLSHCMSPGKFLHLEWKDRAYHTRDPLRFSDSFQRKTAFQRGAHPLIANRIRIA